MTENQDVPECKYLQNVPRAPEGHDFLPAGIIDYMRLPLRKKMKSYIDVARCIEYVDGSVLYAEGWTIQDGKIIAMPINKNEAQKKCNPEIEQLAQSVQDTSSKKTFILDFLASKKGIECSGKDTASPATELLRAYHMLNKHYPEAAITLKQGVREALAESLDKDEKNERKRPSQTSHDLSFVIGNVDG